MADTWTGEGVVWLCSDRILVVVGADMVSIVVAGCEVHPDYYMTLIFAVHSRMTRLLGLLRYVVVANSVVGGYEDLAYKVRMLVLLVNLGDLLSSKAVVLLSLH